MFAANTPLTLLSVSFGVETVDEEVWRVVVLTCALNPFLPTHADALHVRSTLFDASTATPRESIEAITLSVAVPEQRLTIAAAPDAEARITIPNVSVDEHVRVKIKTDRSPAAADAVLKFSFCYPPADVLLFLASSVSNTLYCTFEVEQGDLLTSAEDDGEPIRRGARRTNGANATTH